MIYDNLTSVEDRLGFNFSQPFIGINYRGIHLRLTRGIYSIRLDGGYRIISGFHKNPMELLSTLRCNGKIKMNVLQVIQTDERHFIFHILS